MRRFTIVILLLSVAVIIKAQDITVTGTIRAQDTGEPLPGVNIIEMVTMDGTISDVEGRYTMEVARNATLRFSYIGYLSKYVTITDQVEINVELIPDLLDLEEVMVVGYGIQKKSVVTGSIARVTSEDLANSRDMRIEQSLQGRAAGVIIMSNSGQPGENMSIRIRGTGTNNDPDPLFIVDGLPMEKEGLDFLSPSDIESMEVLKDASSSAIYGARGANGVIIITTRQGKKNQPVRITYDGYYGVQNPWKKLDLLNSQQYIEIINEASANDGRPRPWFSDETIHIIDSAGWDTDWQDEMYYYNAPKTSHSFSFTGGSDKSTYSSSINFYSQDGIVAKGKSKFERINYRLNTSRDFGNLKLGSNLNFTNISKKGISANDQYSIGTNQALNMPPIVPVKFDEDTWGIPSDPLFRVGLQEITNPVALLEYLHTEEKVNKALGNVHADFKIVEGLVFKANFGAEYAFVNGRNYTPVYYIDATHQNDSVDLASKSVDKYVRWNLDNTLTYQKTFGNHSFVGLVGMTHFKEWNEGVWTRKQDLIFDNLDKAYLDNAQNPRAEASGGFGEHTLRSFFGRVNYNYREKYMVEAVFRADGSSRFGSENRYGYFPAVSAGWVLSRESFFPQNNILNYAKTRFSWGQNGNENIGDFRYTSIMSNNSIYFFGINQTMYNGIQPAFYANPSLKWETSEQLNIGIDLAFFNNRLSFTTDYYDKRTKGWLVDAPAMLLIGNVGPTINGGEVKNSGFEFELKYKENITSSLFVNIAVTASTNRSEVLSIKNEEGILEGGTGVHGQGGILRAEIGQPLGFFYGYQTAGIFQSDEELAEFPHQRNARVGDLKFIDTDGNGVLDDADRVNLGNPYPKFIMGINMTLQWKDIDFNMFLYSALGHHIYMANRRADLKYANFTTAVLDRWTTDDPSSDYPRVTLSDPNKTWTKPSDFYIKEADYIRLKNISLGYSLPKAVSDLFHIERIRIYLMGENLLTFTKYPGLEVEMGGGPFNIGIDHGIYPHAKTFIGGLNIIF